MLPEMLRLERTLQATFDHAIYESPPVYVLRFQAAKEIHQQTRPKKTNFLQHFRHNFPTVNFAHQSMDTASAPADSGEEWVFREVTTAGKRLFWTLNGALEDAIQVAPSEYYDPGVFDSMEPYFDPDGSPHAVSQASLMEPPVSSLTVRIQCIDEWERAWDDQHWRCGDLEANAPDRNPGRLGPCPGDETLDPNLYVLECCGQKRPWSHDTQLQVAAQGEFLTVHEYVSAVHPWLMAMRDTLLDVLGKMDFGPNPKWLSETKLAVLYLGPGPLCIGHEDRWARWHRRPTVARPPIEQLSAEEHDRRILRR